MMKEKAPKADNARVRALRLLSLRDHSRVEMIRKLRARGLPEEDIEPSVDRLESEGFLGDGRYAERLARLWAETKLWGNRRIRQKLIQKGIAEDLIREAIAKAEEVLPTSERIQRLLQKQMKGPTVEIRSSRERGKFAQFLSRKGFLWDEIGEALREIGGWVEE